jgi:sRNA-binding protein
MRSPKKQKVYDQAFALLTTMRKRWPNTFKSEDEPALPLAIGIRHQVAKELEGSVRSTVLNTAFHVYCNRASYREALQQPGAMRVDLQGHPVGPVTAEEVRRAAVS